MSDKPSYRIVEDSKPDYFQYYPDPSWTKESFIFSFDYDQQSLEDDEAFQINLFIPHSQEFPCIYIWHGEVNSFGMAR